MSDHLVNPKDYGVDLHDAYASFMGYFERKSIPWWNHSHSSYFSSFGDFLAFGWGAIVVTDRRTGKGHVVVKATGGGASAGSPSAGPADGPQAPHSGHFGTLQQFAKMVRTRFGESLPKLASQVSQRLAFECARPFVADECYSFPSNRSRPSNVRSVTSTILPRISASQPLFQLQSYTQRRRNVVRAIRMSSASSGIRGITRLRRSR